MEHLRQQLRCDVAPGEDDDGLPAVRVRCEQTAAQGRDADRARTLEDEARLVGGEGHGRPDVRLAHREHLYAVSQRYAHGDRARLEVAGEPVGSTLIGTIAPAASAVLMEGDASDSTPTTRTSRPSSPRITPDSSPPPP